jgi:hypothetical protein
MKKIYTHILLHNTNTVDFIHPIPPIYIRGDIVGLFKRILNKKRHTYIYTYDLDELLKTIKTSFKSSSFVYNGKIYVIKIYEGEKAYIIIKDLEFFGQSDRKCITENPQLFLNLLKEIKNEFNVNVNNTFRLSNSSVAMQIFKINYPKNYKLIAELNYHEDSFIRRGYFAGRNEIYTPIVNSPSFYYDINSLYPYIMKTKPLPIGKPTYRNSTYFNSEEFKLNSFYGFVEARVEAPLNSKILPILPFRVDDNLIKRIPNSVDLESLMNLGIIYPEGIFEGVFFSEELKYALSNGYKVIEYRQGYQFRELSILFDNFVDRLYNKRLAASSTLEGLFWKSMLNTLYGRFALTTTTIVNPWHDSSDNDTDDNDFINTFNIDKYRNVAISAAITSWGRIFMHEIIVKHNLNPFYWDTDGIFVPKPLPPDLVTENKELGKFRLESENLFAHFISGKFYYYKPINETDFIHKFRGIPLTSTVLNIKTLVNLFEISPNPYSFKIPITVVEDHKTNIISIETYHKRKLVGANTIPWTLRLPEYVT